MAGIALGNEVEFICRSGVDSYVDAASSLMDEIVKNLGLRGQTARIFEVGNTASETMKSGMAYNV